MRMYHKISGWLPAWLFFIPTLVSGMMPDSVVWNPEIVRNPGQLRSLSDQTEKVHDFLIADWDEDEQDEVALLRTDSNHPFFLVIRELTSDLYTASGQQITGLDNQPSLFSLAGHPRISALTFSSTAQGARMTLFDRRMQPVDTIKALQGIDKQGDGSWRGHLSSAQLIDLNGDDRLDLLVSYNTGADEQPRAIVGYDIRTRRMILEKYFAPMVSVLKVADLNRDGRQEIIAGLAGASDGPFFGEFSRDSCYLAIFDLQGNTLHKIAYGGESSYVNFSVVELNGDGSFEMVNHYFSLLASKNSRSQLQVVDATTLQLIDAVAEVGPSTSFYNVKTLSLKPGAPPVIIAGGRESGLKNYHFDERSRKLVLTQHAITGHRPTYLTHCDLDGDGSQELFFATISPNVIWIVDAQLKPINGLRYAGQADRIKLAALPHGRIDEKHFILNMDGQLYEWIVPLKELFPPPALALQGSGWKITSRNWFFPLLLVIGTMAAVVAVMWLVFRAEKKKQAQCSPDSRRMGMAFLDAMFRIQWCNPAFLRLSGIAAGEIEKTSLPELLQREYLLPFLNAWRSFISRQELYHYQECLWQVETQQHAIAVELFKDKSSSRGIHVLLLDLSENIQSERLKVWAAMAQRMAHKIKTPLSTVLLAVQRLQRGYQHRAPDLRDELDPMAETAITEVERVRSVINTFMKFAQLDPPLFIIKDLTRVVQDDLQDYLRRIPDGIEITTQFESENLPVKVDLAQFCEAFFNVLDNAVTAMQGAGRLTIHTQLETSPLQHFGGRNYAIVEVSDSGPGIPSENLKEVFRPGFTTSSSGSGLGLVFARSIIESHGGEIDIESEEGRGTTIFIRMPLQKHRGNDYGEE